MSLMCVPIDPLATTTSRRCGGAAVDLETSSGEQDIQTPYSGRRLTGHVIGWRRAEWQSIVANATKREAE